MATFRLRLKVESSTVQNSVHLLELIAAQWGDYDGLSAAAP